MGSRTDCALFRPRSHANARLQSTKTHLYESIPLAIIILEGFETGGLVHPLSPDIGAAARADIDSTQHEPLRGDAPVKKGREGNENIAKSI